MTWPLSVSADCIRAFQNHWRVDNKKTKPKTSGDASTTANTAILHGLGRDSLRGNLEPVPHRRAHPHGPGAYGPLAPAQARPAATHKKFSIAMRTIEPSTKGPDGRGRVDVGFEFFLLLGTSEEASLERALLEAWGFGIIVFPLGVAILASSAFRSRFRSRRAAAQAPALTDPRLTPPRDRAAPAQFCPAKPWPRPSPPRLSPPHPLLIRA